MLVSTLLVTVRGPFEPTDLELPGDVSVDKLIPLLLEICDSQQNDPKKMHLQVEGMLAPLSPAKTLIDADVCDGAILELQTEHPPSIRSQSESLASRPFVPGSVQPGKA